jgi:hypothetical protein
MTQTAHQPNAQERQAWEQLLSTLADEVEQWSKARQWAVSRHNNSINDKSLGDYQAPVLHIHTGKGTLVIEPVARRVSNGDGRVDLIGLGSFKRLLLIRRGSSWALFTEDRVPWPQPWNESTFQHVAEALTEPL